VFEIRAAPHDEADEPIDRILDFRRGESLADGEIAVFVIKGDFRWADIRQAFHAVGRGNWLIKVGRMHISDDIK
jgi:hypothetical protein